MSEMVERVAKAIANENGDAWDDTPNDKSHWTKERGMFAGRCRDINEPFKGDYADMARAAIKAMREPTEAMRIERAFSKYGLEPFAHWRAMIDAALEEPK